MRVCVRESVRTCPRRRVRVLAQAYEPAAEFVAGPFEPFKEDRAFANAYLKNAGKWG